jgi:ABC-type glycerol-3-phosphate transport system substrate-binding protein
MRPTDTRKINSMKKIASLAAVLSFALAACSHSDDATSTATGPASPAPAVTSAKPEAPDSARLHALADDVSKLPRAHVANMPDVFGCKDQRTYIELMMSLDNPDRDSAIAALHASAARAVKAGTCEWLDSNETVFVVGGVTGTQIVEIRRIGDPDPLWLHSASLADYTAPR